MTSTKNASLFCSQLATLIGSGLPLDRALTTLTRSAPSRGLRRIAAGLKTRIAQGDSLAQALAPYRAHLPRLFAPLLEVGEQTGRLEDTLNALAAYYDAQWDLQRTTMSQLIPMFFYFGLCGLLIVFIGFIRSGWNMDWLLGKTANIGFVIAFAVLVLLAVKWIPAVRAIGITIGSFVPFVAGILRQSAISRFALSMRAALGAGLDIWRAIPLSANAMGNPFLATRTRRAMKGIEQGLTITQSLDSTRVFGPEAIGLFEAGELSGRLDDTMGHVAVASRLRATTAARTTLRIFTICIYVGMLLYVATIIISMYAGPIRGIFKQLESLEY